MIGVIFMDLEKAFETVDSEINNTNGESEGAF